MYFRPFLALRRVACAVLCLAASAGIAQAACYGPDQALPAQTVATFLADPGQLLQPPQYTSPAALTSQIRDLVASDPATLQPILQLLANATKEQKSAIGSGLGQAAKVCVKTDQAYANQIQFAIAKTKDEDAWLAYTQVTGEIQLGGVGSGPGSAGAVGGATNPLPSGPSATGAPLGFANSSSPTGTFNVSSGTSGASGTGTTTTGTTITNSVSQ